MQSANEFFVFGVQAFDKGDYATAINAFNQAISIEPHASDYYVARGTAYCRSQVYRKGISDYREAAQLDPQSVWAHLSIAWFHVSCRRWWFRSSKKAWRSIQRARELISSDDWRIADVLAASFANDSMYAWARDAAQISYEMAPPSQRESIQRRIELYKARKPFRV